MFKLEEMTKENNSVKEIDVVLAHIHLLDLGREWQLCTCVQPDDISAGL